MNKDKKNRSRPLQARSLHTKSHPIRSRHTKPQQTARQPAIKWFGHQATMTVTILLSLLIQGCSTLYYKHSQSSALDKYLVVTGEPSNFADSRLNAVRNYSASMNGFIKSHGLPSMIYEFQSNHKDGIMLFYISENLVYSFVEASSDPDSRYLIEHRSPNDKELGVYIYLTTGNLPNYKLGALEQSI